MSVNEDHIGETPLIKIEIDEPPSVYAKVEWFNCYSQPYGGGSIKTRIAKTMLDKAEQSSAFDEDMTIVEPTSGNTGCALSRVAANRGYDVEIFMASDAPPNKKAAIRETGATIHEIDGDYDTVIERCMDYVDANPEKYYSPNQYENPQNPLAHEWNTATEIWEQIPEHITHLVGGAGTGGSITGLAHGLSAFHRMGSSSSLYSDAEHSPLSIIAYEPETGEHHIEGLKYMQGTVHKPSVYNEEVIDTKYFISTTRAFEGAKSLREKYTDKPISIVDTGQHDESTVRKNLRVDGDFKVGPSSGAAFSIINKLAQSTDLSVDDTLVFLLYDRGDRYQELPIFE